MSPDELFYSSYSLLYAIWNYMFGDKKWKID